MSTDSKRHSTQEAIDRLRSDLGNLDPAVHGEDLAAATAMALDDLRYLEEQYEALREDFERRSQSWEERGRRIAELLEQYETLVEAARPIVDSWDFHAADYLAELVDGDEQRIIPATYVAELIEQQARLRAALSANPAKEPGP